MDNSVSKSLIIWALSIALAVSFSLPNLGSIHRYRVSATVVVIPLMSQSSWRAGNAYRVFRRDASSMDHEYPQ